MAMVLVVDDRAVNREFLTMLLGYAGHRVFEAADGGAALEMMRLVRPDLIISDIVMPGMDGVEFARRLRDDAAVAQVPIIFFTASYRLGDARSMAQTCGVDTVLTKPSRPQDILKAVAAALGFPATLAVKIPPLAESLSIEGQDLNLSLRLSMLIELGLDLAARRDPQQLLELACRAAQDIFSAQYVAVGIVEDGATRLSRFAARGFAAADVMLAAVDTRAGILGAVLQEDKPARLQGLAGNEATRGLPAGHPPIDALLAVPLTSARRAYGWLYMANRLGHVFNEVDEQIALTLASTLSLAYENLHLFETLQHHAARLAADAEAIRQLNAGLAQQTKEHLINETRFRLAMDAGKTFAYMLDRDLRFTWAHCGRSDGEEQPIVGKTCFDLFTDESARTLTALFGQVMTSRKGLHQDVAIRRLTQPLIQRQFEVIVQPLTEDTGEVTGLICTAADVTERKQVEEQLLAAKAAAERANNAKSRFLAAASHDLRQPLSALTIYADILNSKVAAADRSLVAKSKDCIGGLSALLNDLLDLSKLEAGVVRPNPSDFAIASMLASLKSTHTPEAQLKGIELRVITRQLTAHTDAVLFRRILGNLVENAIRYTEHGGVLVGCRRRQGKTWIEVWDTGIGIAEDKTNEIFEEFRQLGDDARTRGSGLGLAIVAKTAALLGLTFGVRSQPGRGSVFAVEMPLGREPLMPAAEPCEIVRRPLRIALVEDNAMVREAFSLALRETGHQVVAAATGKELRAGLDNRPPDIVVSDYRLTKGETGFDVIAALRATMGEELPAILITGDTDPNLLRSMADRGIVALHKPVDTETLQAYLEDLTRRTPPRRASRVALP